MNFYGNPPTNVCGTINSPASPAVTPGHLSGSRSSIPACRRAGWRSQFHKLPPTYIQNFWRRQMNRNRILQFLTLLIPLCMGPPSNLSAETSFSTDAKNRPYRPSPTRLVHKPEVILEWADPQDECPEEKVCILGQLRNAGGKTAYNVHLQIDIGGTKYIKPTTYLYSRVDQTMMKPGDQQEFYMEIDRKVPYKKRGKIKVIEVGKYNFKIVPIWTKTKKLNRKQKRVRKLSLN
ncbi:hypothetical protein BVX98_01925 [bacterium F11]|nr:hypothetical protein BVX98_01925 [bacterium F11]